MKSLTPVYDGVVFDLGVPALKEPLSVRPTKTPRQKRRMKKKSNARQHRLPEVCMIPDCGCTGLEHP